MHTDTQTQKYKLNESYGRKVHYIQPARSPSIFHHASVLPRPHFHEPGCPPPIDIKLTMIQNAEQ